MAIIVHTYGARAHWARNLPQQVTDQLWLAHRLREDLVAAHHAYQDAAAAVWSAHPPIADVETRIAALEADRAALADQAGKARTVARSRRADSAASRQLPRVRAELKEAKARRRDLIAQFRVQARPQLKAATDAERAAAKELYRVYCQEGRPCRRVDGSDNVVKLYWSVYNDVTTHHRTAVARVHAARQAGHPATLRHHHWDGGASLYTQLMHQAGDPPATSALLASSGGKWRNVLQLDSGDPDATGRRRGRGRAQVRIGPSPVEIPVTMHRDLPDNADVSGAHLVARRIGSHHRAALHVTCRVPDPAPRDPTGRPVFAVHLGWRRETDGSVRVATWRSTLPVVAPTHGKLGTVLRQDTDRTGAVVLPPGWRRRLAEADKRRGWRDHALNDLRERLVAHLQAVPPVDGDGWPTAAEVARWRSPSRFARLALAYREQPPRGRDGIVAALDGWRRGDKHRWNQEAHGRRKVLGRRADAYADAAVWIVSTAGRVVVDDTAVSDVARHSPPGPDAPATALEDAAASQRVHAAPGSLRQRLRITAAREGVEVVEVPHAGITRTHYRCGHLNPADMDYTIRVVTCQGCGQGYDQDASATLTVLAASGDMPPPGLGAARDAG